MVEATTAGILITFFVSFGVGAVVAGLLIGCAMKSQHAWAQAVQRRAIQASRAAPQDAQPRAPQQTQQSSTPKDTTSRYDGDYDHVSGYLNALHQITGSDKADWSSSSASTSNPMQDYYDNYNRQQDEARLQSQRDTVRMENDALDRQQNARMQF
jgi:hypothetical protein